MANNFSKLFASAARSKKFYNDQLEVLTEFLLIVSGLRNSESKALLKMVQVLNTRLEKSGAKYLTNYLKACVRICLFFLSGRDHRALVEGEAWVHRGVDGLPKVIPLEVRRHFVNLRATGARDSLKVVRVCLSILCFYRILKVGSKVDLSTITSPFTGEYSVLPSEELARAVAKLPKFTLRKGAWGTSEKAGPNGPRAAWFAMADAMAFYYHPKNAYHLYGYMLSTGQVLLSCWFTLALVVAGPTILWMVLWELFHWKWGAKLSWGALSRSIPNLIGGLAVIQEGAGKNRVVAKVDWWSQAALKGLHDSIYRLLGEIPNDGTFDQWKPIVNEVLPRTRLGKVCSSYDLSAATDRLPIDLQVEILSLLIGPKPAKHWKGLLDRPWDDGAGTSVRYSVGQPMGAYSSWAMLALTHHLIVQVCASRAGYQDTWYPGYGLLGDDIVITEEEVASQYHTVMTALGVKINLMKSVVSNQGLLEFAKRWHHPLWGDMSPVAGKLLGAVVMNYSYLPILLVNLAQLGFIHSPTQYLAVGLRACRYLGLSELQTRAVVVALLNPKSKNVAFAHHPPYTWSEDWAKYATGTKGGICGPNGVAYRKARDVMFHVLKDDYNTRLAKAKGAAFGHVVQSVRNFRKYPMLLWAGATPLLGWFLRWLSPVPYLYILRYLKDAYKLYRTEPQSTPSWYETRTRTNPNVVPFPILVDFDLARKKVQVTMERYISLVLDCSNTAESYWSAMRDQVTSNYSIYADENERRLKACSGGYKTRRNILRSRLALRLGANRSGNPMNQTVKQTPRRTGQKGRQRSFPPKGGPVRLRTGQASARKNSFLLLAKD